ncbi:hypothetical protein HMPREF0201_03122 [Cedecea davisae DSM 4568]|uniref:Uncharacterized protein n=1 Tax=Cedecea davisae DSM 4568 TaxID=566551 RepID=S3ISE5_9ENTR|nr:hypothetical protein HMPREF0201_03122 [Cedecea davisae DSM 4568]
MSVNKGSLRRPFLFAVAGQGFCGYLKRISIYSLSHRPGQI